MAKPVGARCNLRCDYCFYLEKADLFAPAASLRMSEATLETFIRERIAAQDGEAIEFAWQGGEPTLLGVDFFRRAVELQQRWADGRRIHNALQTNGTLLDDEWGEFLAANAFLVGISIDGPGELHDAYRKDTSGGASLTRVLQGLRTLQKHAVEFNTLTVVHRRNARQALPVYRFLKEISARHLQFIPLVERSLRPGAGTPANALTLAPPPVPGQAAAGRPTPWSVSPTDYGHFLVTVFDEWLRRDVGSVFVQMFESALGSWFGTGASLCVFAPQCGRALALEHDGSVYACDHYVYPQYGRGRIGEQALAQLVDSPAQRSFGSAKSSSLPAHCRRCEFLFACHGGCPKHRFLSTPAGEPGLNYLCAAYRRFFHHVDPALRRLAQLLHSGGEAADIMPLARQSKGRLRYA